VHAADQVPCRVARLQELGDAAAGVRGEGRRERRVERVPVLGEQRGVEYSPPVIGGAVAASAARVASSGGAIGALVSSPARTPPPHSARPDRASSRALPGADGDLGGPELEQAAPAPLERRADPHRRVLGDRFLAVGVDRANDRCRPGVIDSARRTGRRSSAERRAGD